MRSLQLLETSSSGCNVQHHNMRGCLYEMEPLRGICRLHGVVCDPYHYYCLSHNDNEWRLVPHIIHFQCLNAITVRSRTEFSLDV